MTHRRFVWIAAAMVLIAAAVRISNVIAFPELRAYDGFGHFTYIWFLAEERRVPLATTGWSFFHPPVYYALMASIWELLRDFDPVARLKMGTALVAMLGLSHAWVSYVVVRRYFPSQRLIHLLAPGLMLFLPVHLYTAGFLGNENLNAVFCSWSLLALLWVLARPTWPRAAILGLLLGLGMLTKFTALVLVAGSFGTLALRTVLRREWASGIRTMAFAGVVMLAVCGSFYARNITLYGTPFKMSRELFMVQRLEHVQTRGTRGFLEYVLFDPVILYRPQWPRGLPLSGNLPPGSVRSALRESVWTGIYANAWFDGGQGIIVPPPFQSEISRRAGQLLLTLGLVPSLLVLVGLARSVRRLAREGWDDTLVAMLMCFAAMLIVLIQGTRAVPLHVAVKTTYLLPMTVGFSFWFAMGLDWLRCVRAGWMRYVGAACAALATLSVAVFWHLSPATHGYLEAGREGGNWSNLYGIVYYAGGRKETARELFDVAAAAGWHLGYENLAALAHEEGRPLEAVYYLRDAARVQPLKSFGLTADRARFDRESQAEYANLESILYYELGWVEDSVEAAARALQGNRELPEAAYNLGVGKLTQALASDEKEKTFRRTLIEQAGRQFSTAFALDPVFFDAEAMSGVVAALLDECHTAERLIGDALEKHPGQYRFYPTSTGPGDMHSAGLERRRHIEALPEKLEPKRALERCRRALHGAT